MRGVKQVCAAHHFRDALRRIIANGRLTDADIGELVDLCKQGKGAPVGALKAVPLEKAHLPANPGQTAAVSLLSIADVTGVNNLAAGQALGFEPNGITIIYGDNGAGKSGYARILKRACRARHAGKIEPNVYADQPPKRVGANIAYGVGGVPQPVEQWQNGANPHATLSAVSVFDSDCASVHIREKNEVAFRPFGLDVPDELAAACQAVKDALAAEQKQLEKARNPIFAAPTWKSTTAVGKALAALNEAEIVFGGERHIALVGSVPGELRPWPQPFRNALPAILAEKGRNVCVLATSDPFHYGIGNSISRSLKALDFRLVRLHGRLKLFLGLLNWPTPGVTKRIIHGRHIRPPTSDQRA